MSFQRKKKMSKKKDNMIWDLTDTDLTESTSDRL